MPIRIPEQLPAQNVLLGENILPWTWTGLPIRIFVLLKSVFLI